MLIATYEDGTAESFLFSEWLFTNCVDESSASEECIDALYLAWIRTLRCSACGKSAPSEAAHTGNDGGTGIKASDYSAIPLCAHCHRVGMYSYHAAGKKTFAAMYCLDYDALVQKYRGIWEQLQGVEVFKRERGA